MSGAEAGVVVLLPTQGGGTRRGPTGAWPPRFDLDPAVPLQQMNRGGAFGREGRAPSFAVV